MDAAHKMLSDKVKLLAVTAVSKCNGEPWLISKTLIAWAKEYEIPVWVMEPLKRRKTGFFIRRKSGEVKRTQTEEKIPAWAFRFLQSIPEVTVVLSGMSNMEQLKENIRTFETEKPLSKEEMDSLFVRGKNDAGRHTSMYRLPLLCKPLPERA